MPKCKAKRGRVERTNGSVLRTDGAGGASSASSVVAAPVAPERDSLGASGSAAEGGASASQMSIK